MASASLLHIPSGTRFGYRTGLPWQTCPHCLVETPHAVNADPGLHLLVAPNGSGKTTLLKTLAGLIPPLEGGVSLGAQVHYFADELRADPEMTPRTFFRSWFSGEAFTSVENLADSLRLDLKRPIGKLSRGNRQKVLLIMAEVKAAQSPSSLLLMDEPLTGLDAETREQVTQLWSETRARTVRLVVMHELECVRQADSLLTIARGKLLHTRDRVGASWMDTYHTLQPS